MLCIAHNVFIAATHTKDLNMQQQKRTFVKLVALNTLWQDDARWQANLRDSGVEEGLTFATDNGDDGEMVLQDFACDEMCFAGDEHKMYDFAGSATEQERFYGRDIVLYTDKATGNLWALWQEGMDEF
jgi:hypothetical protein